MNSEFYRDRAEWHGKMAAYCVGLAAKLGIDTFSAEGYVRDAYVHARCAGHYGRLADGQTSIHHVYSREDWFLGVENRDESI